MIQSVTFSKPVKECEAALGRPYIRIKIRADASSAGTGYFAELFTEKQAFHQHMTKEELDAFIAQHAGVTFKNCVMLTDTEEITILANKKGKKTELHHQRIIRKASGGDQVNAHPSSGSSGTSCSSLAEERLRASVLNAQKAAGSSCLLPQQNRVKKYLLPEGTPVPFLVRLGVMTADGKVIAAKYDKFRQINRFLEFIDDILDEVTDATQSSTAERPLRIADFGCGKSYLTFAVHYYLAEIKQMNVEIIGLDLKKDVITYCSQLASELHCTGLSFAVGNIAEYEYQNDPDLVITLHACDTATDFALNYAVRHHCTAILSVPCCQHEINQQLAAHKSADILLPFAPLLKYGLIRERFAALATDALRAEYLETAGYSVQLLEFIDMEHTPKNILIRAVKGKPNENAQKEANALTAALNVTTTIGREDN